MTHARLMPGEERCPFDAAEGPRETNLAGTGVRLRDGRPSDIDDYVRWHTADTEWADWDSPWTPLGETRDAVRERLTALLGLPRPHPRRTLEICLPDGAHAGRVTRYADGEGGVCHLGIDVFESRLWGRGIGREALDLWIGYLAAHGVGTVRYGTWGGNSRMLALARRLGFREVERQPDSRVVRGRAWDRVVLELRRDFHGVRCGAPVHPGTGGTGMPGDIRVRPLTPDLHAEVLRIADSLPEWFTERGRAMIRADLPFQQGLVALDGTRACVGFLLFYAAEGVGRIGWMGVDPALHRRGIGRALVRAAEERLASAGIESLDVFTLGDGVDYEPYARTRAFYRALGFATHKREFHDNPECPESVILRKPLARAPGPKPPGPAPVEPAV